MRCPHTSCYRGKRVIVVLRSGRRIVGKFQERLRCAVVLDTATIRTDSIRSFIIDRRGSDESRVERG